MNNLNITERRNKSVVVLDLKGNIKLGKGNVELHQAIRLLVEKGEKNILLNLAEVDHIDSSGLGEMIACHITVKKSGGEMKLLNLTKRVRELMVITKLLTVFYAYNSESEAVNSFQEFFKNTETKESNSISV